MRSFGRGMPTAPRSSIDALLGLLLRDVVVHPNRLHDLVADAVHGMQARERILEDHGDLFAPDLPKLVLRQRERSLSL